MSTETPNEADDMIAIVSHDLKNPLNTIFMTSSLMSQDIPEGPPGDRLRKRVERIQRSVDIMRRLIDDLLDMEQMAHGRLSLRPDVIDMGAIISEVVEEYHEIAHQHGIRLEALIPEKPLLVMCDHQRIRQVFYNLLSNAIKYTSPNPDGLVQIQTKSTDGFAQVDVFNSGNAIAGEHQQRIFERFTRIEHTGRAGMGLGLFICKWIIDAHNGMIWVDSNDNGNTFSFKLPKHYDKDTTGYI
jgi:signal transduction histidine kinase